MGSIRRHLLALSPEWTVVAALLAVTLSLHAILRVPLEWSSASPILSHIFALASDYVFVAIWFWLVLKAGAQMNDRADLLRGLGRQISDGLCFGAALSLSLYLKLFVPLVRSASYDRLYESLDRRYFAWMDPLIHWRARALPFRWVDSLYFFCFFGMFLVSFVIHGLRNRSEFRRVFLASILVQGAGGLLYFVAPAMGPFLFHRGANGFMRSTEHVFYVVRGNEMAGGAAWFSAHAGQYLTSGLGAMPSLHAAASFVFLYYALRYVRWLGLLYVPVFVWLLFGAMATRWHYGIDLIAGIVLAFACIAVANRWIPAHEAAFVRESRKDPSLEVVRENPQLV